MVVNKILKRVVLSIAFLGMIIVSVSCSSSTGYNKYINNSLLLYPAKVDTLIAIPGPNQVLFKVPKPNDPRVVKVGFFWRNNTDSLKVEFPQQKDTLQVLIDNLEAIKKGRLYTFNVYTYTQSGHRSVKVTKSVLIHGK